MTKLKIAILTIILATRLSVVTMMAQEQTTAPDNAITVAMPLSPAQIAQITEDMTGYIYEVMEVEEYIADASSEDIKTLQTHLESIDVRWQAYTQIEMVDIAATPPLMELLSQYKVAYVAATDSLANQQKRLAATTTFLRAQAFITQHTSKFKALSTKAFEYSLVQQTATQLADVKAQAAMLMTQVEEYYQKAVEASQMSEEAKAKMPALQQQYVEIQAQSEKIQAAVYKPWIMRIKDYVLTFAGVAIILIFFNFIITKAKAMKQARDLAKKYNNMLNGNDEYPTI